MQTLFEIKDLCVAYARKGLTLDKVSLSVPAGGIVALLGANGAGKTTLIRAVSGLLQVHGGSVLGGEVNFIGKTVLGMPSHRLVRAGITQVPEGRMVFKQLNVEENLLVGAAILPRGEVAARMEAVYDLFPQLRDRRTQTAGWMSGGEQQMLALGRALVSGPRLLLIDELSLGLAPLIVQTIYQRLTVVSRTMGTSMLVIEQNARLALEFASTAYVLDRGRIVLSGPAAEVAASPVMQESYLGSKHRTPQAVTPAMAGEV